MVYRDGGQGTFVLDLRLGKLGRLKRASGTTDLATFRDCRAMLVRLRRDRRWDVLALVMNGLVTPLELLDARDRGELDQLPSADELRSLPRAIEAWLRTADVGPRTRDDYTRRLVFPADARVLALPDLLTAARTRALESGKRQTFNNQLDAARSFVRDTFSPDHRLRKAVALLAPLTVTHRPGNPQEPDQIRALALRFRFADALWALCLTGMRRGEYWGSWEVAADRIVVRGTKTAAAHRVVPLVYRPARSTVAYSTFYHAIRGMTDGALNIHDLRKTAQRWWEDAGIPDWRIRLYAGHAGKGELDTIYRKPRDLTRLLVEDAERVRTWLGDPPQAAIRAVPA